MALKMVFRNALGLCAVVGLSCWAFDAGADKLSTGDEKTDAMMVEMQKKASDITSCKARTVMTLQIEDQTLEVRGQGIFRGPGQIRLEKVLPDGGRQTLVAGGGLLWIYDDQERIASRVNLARVYEATKQEADGDHADALRPFRGLQWKTIRYVGDETLGEIVHRVFEAAPDVPLLQAQLQTVLSKARIYLHPDDGLLRLIRFYDASGNEVISHRFDEVVVNPELDRDTFEFVIPAGAHIMDSTDDMIALLKGE